MNNIEQSRRRSVLRQILVGSLLSLTLSGVRAETNAPIDCKCELLTCGPCESEVDIKFYSSKCGENLTRTKSCKKSICEAVPNQDKCFAELGIQNKNMKQADGAPVHSRSPASEVLPVGFIETSIGKAEIHRDNEPTQLSSKNLKIFENDRIVTDDNAKVKIVFEKTKDELHINPNSKVFIQKFLHPNDPDDNPSFKKTVIKLDLGKIRVRLSKTAEKYDHERNTFEVKTKTAVAGVRGTDFVMSYNEDSKASDLQTLAGAVEMSAQNSGEMSGSSVLVSAGESCNTIVKADFSEITPPKKLDAKSLKLIDQATEVKEIEKTSSNEAAKSQQVLEASNSVCQSPSADFKECAWFCEGNPKKESHCRTDLKEVSCVRKMCGANGQWILPTRMPSSEATQCSGRGPTKGPCGTYW